MKKWSAGDDVVVATLDAHDNVKATINSAKVSHVGRKWMKVVQSGTGWHVGEFNLITGRNKDGSRTRAFSPEELREYVEVREAIGHLRVFISHPWPLLNRMTVSEIKTITDIFIAAYGRANEETSR